MKTNRFLGSILLIAGTAIGAGMIALPVVTGIYGFYSSLLLFIGVWLFTTYAAFLLLEANLWFKKDSNLITMARAMLGKPGEILAWLLSVVFLYTLMTAYLSGLSEMFNNTLQMSLSIELSDGFYTLLITVILALLVWGQRRNIDYINRFFVAGLIISYIVLLFYITPQVNLKLLTLQPLQSPLAALPVVLGAFGYNVIVPSIRSYLGDNIKQIRWSILIGGSIPLLIYILWELAVLGTIPVEGNSGLASILANGEAGSGITKALSNLLHTSSLVIAVQFFIFFAIASSMAGVVIALFDILADGLPYSNTSSGKWLVIVITFLPPLLITLLFPNLFILAIGYAGILNVILFFILPAIMVRRGRITSQATLTPVYQVAGGRIGQSLIFAFSSIVIFMEIALMIGWIK